MSGRNKSMGGVTEFQYRKAMESIKKKEQQSAHTIDAAALQADMAKRFNLTSISNRNGSRPSQSNALVHANSSASSSSNSVICECCRNANVAQADVCVRCGFYLTPTPVIPESLAQKRGLVAAQARVQTLSEQEWNSIENNIRQRSDPDSCCPICMEGFNQGHEVLLSCSHIFHRPCLQSFEKFMKNGQLTCPICRTTNYQKKITHIGTRAFQSSAVKRIQRMWRGYRARKLYKVHLRSFYRGGRGDEGLRKRYYEAEVTSIASRLADNVEFRAGKVDSMLSSVDRTLSDGRDLDALFEAMVGTRLRRAEAATTDHHPSSSSSSSSNARHLSRFDSAFSSDRHYNSTYYEHKHSSADGDGDGAGDGDGDVTAAAVALSTVDWAGVFAVARKRGHGDCAICMSACAAAGGGHGKRNVILSCSHVFHGHCIGNFERFMRHQALTCPVCRREYEKMDYTV